MFDYSDVGPTPQIDWTPAERMAERLMALYETSKRLKELTARNNEEIQALEYRLIPDFVGDTGDKKHVHPLKTGLEIVVEEKVHAHISEAHAQEAFQWMDREGYGFLLETKRQVITRKLEPFVKDLLKKEVPFPKDLFGVFLRKKATVRLKKK